MPKTWNRGDAKKFARQVQLGKSYYIVYKIATNLAPYEDPKLCSEIVFTERRPFTGTPSAGSMDAVTLCQNYGPVYDTPPRGIRNIATPGPQVGAPLGNDYQAPLDEVELRGLEKRVNQTLSPRQRRALSARRP